MLLKGKNAIIYGAGGSVGNGVAKAFAAEGAKVFLAGRTLASLENTADAIRKQGGIAEIAQLDALKENEVNKHADEIASKQGSIDISFNLIGLEDIHGTPLRNMQAADFTRPISIATQSQFITTSVASRYMVQQRSGVILMLTASIAIRAGGLVGGFGVACSAMEGICRTLSGELGPHGVRVVCLRSAGSPDAKGVDEVFDIQAKSAGISRAEFQRRIEDTTLLKRLPSLADISNVASFMASDKARGITAAVVNVTCGGMVD